MSDRRAAIRREKMDRERVKKHKSPEGDMERAILQATQDGRVYAVCIVFLNLKKHFGFRTKNLGRLLEISNKEALKFSQAATQFNLLFYQKKLAQLVKGQEIKMSVRTPREKAYEMRKMEMFLSSCSLLCMVLYQEFGYSTNAKGTGRLDKIMQVAVADFLEAVLNKKKYTVEYYVKKLEKETEICLTD